MFKLSFLEWTNSGCKNFNYCHAFPCAHGSCENVISSKMNFRRCNCENTGYIGLDCHINVDECSLSDRVVCQNHAKCEDTIGSFTCKCVSPFHGTDCSSCNRSAVDGDLCENFMVRLLGANTQIVQLTVLSFSCSIKAVLLGFIILQIYRQVQRRKRRKRRKR